MELRSQSCIPLGGVLGYVSSGVSRRGDAGASPFVPHGHPDTEWCKRRPVAQYTQKGATCWHPPR